MEEFRTIGGISDSEDKFVKSKRVMTRDVSLATKAMTSDESQMKFKKKSMNIIDDLGAQLNTNLS